MGREATGEGEAKSDGDKATTTPSEDGEGTAGDVPGYQPNPEDLDCGVRVNSVWKA